MPLGRFYHSVKQIVTVKSCVPIQAGFTNGFSVLVRIRTRFGRFKREVFVTPALNHIVVELLLAAICEPPIAARVKTVEMCVSGGTCSRWSHHVPSRPIGTHLTTTNRLSIFSRCLICKSPLRSQCPSRRHAPTHSSRKSVCAFP